MNPKAYFLANDASNIAYELGDACLRRVSHEVCIDALNNPEIHTEDDAYACVVFAAQLSLGMAAV